jgi:dsDNA-specific endonuclease/ATPase MutS2
MAKFKIGDKVAVLDDNMEGVVKAIQGDTITLLTSEGFELDFQAYELISLNKDLKIENNIFNSDIHQAKSLKEQSQKPKPVFKTKTKEVYKPVIDLHIHQLVEKTAHLNNYDMLNIQLDTAKYQLERAIANRTPKIVFIHGVGEGVLKMELETLLRRYDNVTFYEADFKTYGFGATEVKIFQNKSN